MTDYRGMPVLLLQRLLSEHDATIHMEFTAQRYSVRVCKIGNFGDIQTFKSSAKDLEAAISKALEQAGIPAFW